MGKKKKGKAIIVGGSIAGLSCAHSLTLAGWDVLVLEKSSEPPVGSPTGAGLGLDPQARQIIKSWLPTPHLLDEITLPLSIDQNQTTDSEKKVTRILTRYEDFDFRAAYWSDIHSLLYKALPQTMFLWGHKFLSFTMSQDESIVKVQTLVIETQETVEIQGDLLVAADGCLSSIRKSFLPDFKLRYSGYCAWRGVFDFSGNENSETVTGIKKVYPDLGKCLYFDLGEQTHTVFYELFNKKLNWIWYVNQPEPDLKSNSVTLKVSQEMINKMHQEAETIWIPELARLMRETKDPFLNVIYDCDPLERIFWGNIVLVGDAAHPTTPHGLRSTNMSVLDSEVLGKCLEKCGPDNLSLGLEEYQRIRLPVVSEQVLYARRLGRIKQGLDHDGIGGGGLEQRTMPFFSCAPLV
ncbi:FAD/NAD(P)-binding domain superfamily [Arabidopsis thaliana x Arabidopsis arenosa]|uniref:FAD/NAD(P)-binding domain superfamily n=1 Tax=Arabidopsis thaliana x Arabidopsis arenosa TaxID=1240361 RepID=A0A8T1YV21_9BRAS|nr:FAD/NAD(P)-binding domain superfamily [Arabidopsis thaliana x Arabidopsis arenosa]